MLPPFRARAWARAARERARSRASPTGSFTARQAGQILHPSFSSQPWPKTKCLALTQADRSWASRPLWLLTPFSVLSSPPSLFTVIAHVLHAVSPAICFSDCLWGGVRQRPTADNGQRRLPTSVLALDVNASAILRLRLPSTTSRTPPSGAGHVRSSCTTSTTSWRSVAGEYRKSASIPSRGEGSPIPWPGELGRGVWVPRVSGKRGARELERASSQSYSARNCDTYPVPRRFPVDRQPHSHRFCASTGDRKSNHQVAPIVCSQFALLSPDSATSQQSIALYSQSPIGLIRLCSLCSSSCSSSPRIHVTFFPNKFLTPSSALLTLLPTAVHHRFPLAINRPPTGGDLTFSWKKGHI